MVGLGLAADLPGDREDAREAVGHLLEEPLARVGERERAVAPLEQAHAHRALEMPDRLAHRRLGDPELGGRAREGQVAGRGLEDHEVVHPPDLPLDPQH